VSYTSAGLSLTSCNVVFVSFPCGFRPTCGPAPPTILASCRFRLAVWPAHSICVYTYVRSSCMRLLGKNGEYLKQFGKIKLEVKRTITRPRLSKRVTRWRSWLRHCATSQEVACSNPDGVIGIFHWHNPSGRTMALRSTQPLTEMRTRNFLRTKGGRCLGLTTLPPSCADCLEIWESRPRGTLWACPSL